MFIVLAMMMLITGVVYALVSPPFGQVSCNSSTPTVINPAGNYNTLIMMNLTPSTGVYIGPDSSITTTTAGINLSSSTSTAYVADTRTGPYANTVGYASWYCITSSGTATVGWQVR